jgi:hypothetical protein
MILRVNNKYIKQRFKLVNFFKQPGSHPQFES